MPIVDLGTYGATLVLDQSNFNKGMNDAEDKLKTTEGKTKKFGSGLSTLATGAVAGLGAALIGVGTAGITMSGNLQGALNSLKTQTGATDDEMKEMENTLKNLYTQNFGESFQDIADSMAIIKQNTELAGEELENATKNALTLRDTFGLDVTESANAANTLMKQFGLTADEAYNLMAQGAQNGANKNGDMLDVLNEYAPQFKAMGFSAEEMTNILIDGAENGAWSIDKVGDAIKEFNIRAKDGSETSKKAFEDLGFNADEMMSKFAEGGESAQSAFKQVINAINGIEDPVKKNQIGVALFGTQFEDLESEVISAFANIGTEASLSKDALGQINQVKFNSIGEALSAIGRTFTTALITPIQNYVMPLLSRLAQWVMENMPMIQGIFSTVFEAIGLVITGFVNVIQFLIDAFTNASGQTSIIFTTIKDTIFAIFEGLKVIFQTFVDIVIGIWNKYGDSIMNFTKNIFDGISKIISGALKIIKGIIQTVTSIIKGDWQSVWNGIKNILSGVWNTIKGIIQTALDTIKGVISGAFNTIKDSISRVWNGITGFFDDVWDKLMDGAEGFKDAFIGVWDGIKYGVKMVINPLIDLMNGLIDALEFVINAVITGINALPTIELPGWLGGGTFGIPNLNKVNFGNIPKLATGGVVAKPTLAMIGDAGIGNPEIVAPEKKLTEIFKSVLEQQNKQSNRPINVYFGNVYGATQEQAKTFGEKFINHVKRIGGY